MPEEDPRPDDRGWSRSRLLRALSGGAAVMAAGTAIGVLDRGEDPLAAPSEDIDGDILRLFLLLEEVQDAFYRQAVQDGKVTGDLLAFARAAGRQERAHVAFLEKQVSGRRRERPASDFGEKVGSPERFRAAAIELEEAAIAAYIGQAANLSAAKLRAAGTLLSVEARQAAWIRDLDGRSPAPRAADPASRPEDVLKSLERSGYLA